MLRRTYLVSVHDLDGTPVTWDCIDATDYGNHPNAQDIAREYADVNGHDGREVEIYIVFDDLPLDD